MKLLDKIVEETGVPYSIFKLTHAQKYGEYILEYANKGCYLDYTAFHLSYDKRFNPLINAIKNNAIDTSKISISSDLSILTTERGWQGEETPYTILHTIKELIKQGLTFEQVIPFVTTNAIAQVNKRIAEIKEGEVAKLLILNEYYEIEQIINENQIITVNKGKTI